MSEDVVQQIKSALSLSDLIGRYVTLKKKGNHHMACCPFHQEKTASFSVNDQKGFYFCFGCKAGGDHFAFIQAIENLSFTEAKEYLADLAGIELPKYGHSGPRRKDIELYREINEAACTFYEKHLTIDKRALEYLKKRGVQDSTTKLFRLGSAPDQWDGLYQFLKENFPVEFLGKSGLFKMGKTGSYYDIFRDGRLIFPIMDVHGHVVAFGARILEGDGPKYINSPETPIYTKGKHVYNLGFARPYLKKKPDIIVVEGYLDVIQVYQAGIGAVVAPLGTAFTSEQARLLHRYAKNVFLNFDGDRAGFQAARKSIDVLLAQDLDPKVIPLPEGMDPDDFILKEGAETYRKKTENALDFFEFLFQRFHPEDERPNPRQTSVLIRELLPTLTNMVDPVMKEAYLKLLAERTGTSMSSISYMMKQIQASSTRNPGPESEHEEHDSPHHPAESTSRLNLIEEEIIRLLLKVPNAEELLPEDDRPLFREALKNLFEDRPWIMSFLLEEHDLQFDLLRDMPEVHSRQLHQLLDEDQTDEGEQAKPLIYSLFNDLIIIFLKKQSARYSRMRRGLADHEFDKAARFSRKKMELEKKIRHLSQQGREQKGRFIEPA
jgi:DNA primase